MKSAFVALAVAVAISFFSETSAQNGRARRCESIQALLSSGVAAVFNGWCLDSQGNDQNTGVRQLSGRYKTAEDCLKACKKHGGTGCEFHDSIYNNCGVHTKDVASGSGNNG